MIGMEKKQKWSCAVCYRMLTVIFGPRMLRATEKVQMDVIMDGPWKP